MFKSVLVVDDVELSREIVKSSVFKAVEGVKVVAVENAYAAINKMRNKKFDLVIMDIMMPNGDGFELLKLISQLSIATKVIVLSSLDNTVIDLMPEIGKLYEVEVVSSLAKPINSSELTKVVKEVLVPSTMSAVNEVKLIDKINIFDFPISAYYEPQVDTVDGKVIGIDVLGNWSSTGSSSSLLSANLLPSVTALDDKRLYNQILIGRFLQDYISYFQYLDAVLNFTLHVHFDFFDDDFIFDCICEINKLNNLHKLSMYISDFDYLINSSDDFTRKTERLFNEGVLLTAGTQELSPDVVARAIGFSINQLKLKAEATLLVNMGRDFCLFETSNKLALKSHIDLLCDDVEEGTLSAFLTSKGLNKQQGLLFSPPVTAKELVENLRNQKQNIPKIVV